MKRPDHLHTTSGSTSNALGRRSLLKLGGAALVGASVGAGSSAELSARGADVPPATQAASGAEVFRARFVPDGAIARVAYATDHHYWPNHAENWGGGAQITSSSDRRMPDLVATLNALEPDVSIHGGDVISAAGAFFPPAEEYARQLEFAGTFVNQLRHPAIALVGNHETLEPHYASHDQLAAWSQRFGRPYREHDLPGWRLLTLNTMLPNRDSRYAKGGPYNNAYGPDEAQIAWLKERLEDAAVEKRHVVVFGHVPPSDWATLASFEALLASQQPQQVKAIVCGHWHRNNVSFLAGVPVLVRASNVETPFGYSLLHLYRDGRIVMVQHSQHLPYEEFISAGFARGKQGARSDRYVTLGASSRMPLERLTVAGDGAEAAIVDGHLMVSSRQGRATVLIDTEDLEHARLTLTLVKANGDAAGGVALADAAGRGGIEAVVTSRGSAAGQVHLRRDTPGGTPELLKPSWFNIADDISYRLTLEVYRGRVVASWKNMRTLETRLDAARAGRFGCFVERGTIYVTELVLERLSS